MSAVGIVCGLNILAIIACLFVLWAEYDYLETTSKIMMLALAATNVISLLINMGMIR
ncbi:hypothetical protein NIGALANA_49 [Bacillus phage Nigalana]|uniref:Uncharacterized protein n=1 Tax=Bacillus phage Hakuna TaxID=1486659 RepID=A0A024B0R1_9CAUD|nr:hypothetical protein FP72_gp042 [Bacillus phage Hakuna]YP_009282441.1 hypothetical protein BI005_gp049 [Bacillus phage Nigalana]YP_009286924.1 hypothetical protein BI006_gp048 [Bacillus phage Nemo]ASR78659.1 hypothetical protein BUBS_48 [Bacillus phage Bubs]AXQ67544.1 hypothetical protein OMNIODEOPRIMUS_48 [Bacillus phage OmnioDeoPrimus]ULF49254.1 membrane protein [Bacillus phage MrBubbles]AHZ10060.1 hypothetical protein [Bacillus phage Hakuna]AMW61202.1 hypothetical protein NIGALANA_49 [